MGPPDRKRNEEKSSLRTAVRRELSEPRVQVGALTSAPGVPREGACHCTDFVRLPIVYHWLRDVSVRTNLAEARSVLRFPDEEFRPMVKNIGARREIRWAAFARAACAARGGQAANEPRWRVVSQARRFRAPMVA